MPRRRRVHHVRVYFGDPDPLTWREWWIGWAVFSILVVGFFVAVLLIEAIAGNFATPPAAPKPDPGPSYEERMRIYRENQKHVIPPPPALPPYHAPDPVVSMPSMAPPILGSKPKPEPEVEAPVRPSKKPWIELEPRDWEKKGGDR